MGNPPIDYSWTIESGATPISLTGPSIDPLVFEHPGSHRVGLVASNHCGSDTATSTITIYSPPQARFSSSLVPTCEGIVLHLEDETSGADNVYWQVNEEDLTGHSGRSASQLLPYESELRATLVALGHGCADSSYTVHQSRTLSSWFTGKPPTVFTPNNDGVNDVFELPVPESIQDCASLYIYNRWGQKTAERKHTAPTWDGTTAAGDPAAEGVYLYILTVDDASYKGTLTLTR